MSNYANLKAAVNAAITTNGNNEITGAILNDILNTIISTIGGNYTFAGVVTPSTTISAPDANVFWIGGAGTYTQFGGTITIADGNIGVFTYNGSFGQYEVNTGAGGIVQMIGYYECDTAGNVNAKTVSADGYVLRTGGSIKIKFLHRHSSTSEATLNINSTGAKTIYYNDVNTGQQSGYNGWSDNEIVEVFYDGTVYRAYPTNVFTQYRDDDSRIINQINGGEYKTILWDKQIPVNYPMISGKTYNIKLTPIGGTLSANLYALTVIKAGTATLLRSGISIAQGESQTIAVTPANDYKYVYLLIGSASTATQVQCDISLADALVHQSQLTTFATKDYVDNDTTVEKSLYNSSIFTVNNVFCRASNGTEGSNSAYMASDYLSTNGIKELTVYGFDGVSSVGVIVFYNSNKQFISSVAPTTGTSTYTAQVPTNAAYFRLSSLKTSFANYSVTGKLSIAYAMTMGADEVYLSASGDDSNDGLTIETPVATINRAKEISTNKLHILEGDYENLRIIDYNKIEGHGEVNLINYRAKITSGTQVSGYTKVYQATIPSFSLGTFKFIYQHNTADTATQILSTEKHPLHRGKTHRLPSTRLYKVESIADIESASKPSWYVSGTTLYFSIVEGTTLSNNPIIIPVNDIVYSGKEIELSNFNYKYGSIRFNSCQGVLKNLSVGMTQPTLGAVQFIDCPMFNVFDCEAYAGYTTGGGDGFNSHATNDKNCVNYYNCWAHDNSDDGESSHEYSTSFHIGCLYEYNGSGVTPASGGNTQCVSTIARNNGEHTWVEDSTGSGFSAQGNDAHMSCSSCLSVGNKIGYRVTGTGSTFIAYNCISKSDINAYSAVSTELNCITL